ncbi:electron transport complex subunit RsxA [Sulfuriflexus sp.]|uniref:electron transport complex subunit RsxA n=1 Tax=Sulfuriflexus sp. TaxID=2015443 RepID=UPI0028CDE5C9|nr:electron transport complex subunit RsxA [Sulfuriflexus sp.]MDT8404514.1 electron transport complex subunit RsxA [Sulfuriflexus sp.]
MAEYLTLLFTTIFVNNMVLSRFLGLCPFMGVSKKLSTAVGMGMATAFVLTLASMSSYLADKYLLQPFDLGYLKTVTFILLIAAIVQATEMIMHKTGPLLYSVLGIYLPLITTNCAVLGIALLNVQENNDFIRSLLYGFGGAVGFTLVMVLFASIRERLEISDVPDSFKGAPIGLITAGFMSVAFMGFAGMG